MASVDQDLVSDLARHDSAMTLTQLVRYLERHHPIEGPGVPRAVVEAYADELDYDSDRIAASFEDRLTDARGWQPGNRLYRVGENVSIYPPDWHERLAETTDVSEYVSAMVGSIRTPDGVEIDEVQVGVSQADLLTAIEIIAGVDRETARRSLQSQRREGRVVMSAFMNPEEVVRLPSD